MRLVFIHGWAFDARFWDALGAALSDMPQTRVDLGFFSDSETLPVFTPDDILIGHSLGFLWGMTRYQSWRGFVSINGFARFAHQAGVRAMRRGLEKDAAKTVQNFYASIGAEAVSGTPNTARLDAGLEMLQNGAWEQWPANGLALASRNDPLVPDATTEQMNIKTIWHDSAGHLLPLRDAEWCAAAIRKHIA